MNYLCICDICGVYEIIYAFVIYVEYMKSWVKSGDWEGEIYVLNLQGRNQNKRKKIHCHLFAVCCTRQIPLCRVPHTAKRTRGRQLLSLAFWSRLCRVPHTAKTTALFMLAFW